MRVLSIFQIKKHILVKYILLRINCHKIAKTCINSEF
jgi:hypothetical protein